MTDLLDAIDALTLPTVTKVLQANDAGITCLSDVNTPPLLERLREATGGQLGKESSKSLPSQRIPIDSEALFLFAKITGQIFDWANLAKSHVDKGDPVGTLRGWYVAWSQVQQEPAAETARARILSSWAAQIQRKLDPPRVRDLPDECPSCGASTWWRDGAEYPRPLVIEMPREVTANLIQESRAVCRACETVFGVRELAYALESNEGETTNG